MPSIDSVVTAIIGGIEKQVDLCHDVYTEKFNNSFIYLGEGITYKVNGVIQGIKEKKHFWIRKEREVDNG